MNVLWVFAHPDPRSLGGALRDEGLATLRSSGHDVRESDLYAMGWNPIVGRSELIDGTRCPEVVAEQEKLLWADTVVVQFPLWWYGVPAILKGWFDRVFARGFGFDVHGEDGRALRYGEGTLKGKRAMVVLTAGAHEPALGPRGVNGPLDDLLFGLHHGTLFYTGMSVLPPAVVYRANRVSPGEFAEAAELLRKRLHSLETTEPLAFRGQNGGDYDEHLVLRPHVASGETGLGIHLCRT